MPPDVKAVFEAWSVPVPLTLILTVTSLVYWRGWFHLRRALPNFFSVRQLSAFIAGLFALWIAIGSPLAAFDDALLSIHMSQHILLMAVAPPLILLGAPALPLLFGFPKRFVRRILGPALRWRLVQRLGSTFTHPAFCWFSATIAVIVWHLPGVFEFALRSESWHEVEHATFFTTSILFWWPVVQPWPSVARWPRWSIPLYLFLGVLANDAVSAVLALWDRVLYPSYASTDHRLFNLAPLDDQAFAGALMWVFGTLVYLAPAVVITMRLLSPSESSSRTRLIRTRPKAYLRNSAALL
jgi:cytochrome c oxidase assembly factor CtaG